MLSKLALTGSSGSQSPASTSRSSRSRMACAYSARLRRWKGRLPGIGSERGSLVQAPLQSLGQVEQRLGVRAARDPAAASCRPAACGPSARRRRRARPRPVRRSGPATGCRAGSGRCGTSCRCPGRHGSPRRPPGRSVRLRPPARRRPWRAGRRTRRQRQLVPSFASQPVLRDQPGNLGRRFRNERVQLISVPRPDPGFKARMTA